MPAHKFDTLPIVEHPRRTARGQSSRRRLADGDVDVTSTRRRRHQRGRAVAHTERSSAPTSASRRGSVGAREIAICARLLGEQRADEGVAPRSVAAISASCGSNRAQLLAADALPRNAGRCVHRRAVRDVVARQVAAAALGDGQRLAGGLRGRRRRQGHFGGAQHARKSDHKRVALKKVQIFDMMDAGRDRCLKEVQLLQTCRRTEHHRVPRTFTTATSCTSFSSGPSSATCDGCSSARRRRTRSCRSRRCGGTSSRSAPASRTCTTRA